ncbi:MAG: ribosome maturation factor RimM [Ginsengibacter sp.]
MDQYFKIGKLAATFGVEGQLILQHSLGKKNSLKNLATIFIEEKKDSFLPYFITSIKIKNDKEILISLDEISSKEAAHFLLKKEVWLNEEDFKKFVATTAPISFLGYTIVNNQEEIGEVIEVIEQPHQLLCTILINNKEALIPIHEDSLKKVDKKNNKLFVELPDGLLEIYKNA